MKQNEWLFKEVQKIKLRASKNVTRHQIVICFALCFLFLFLTAIHCKEDFTREERSGTQEARSVWVCPKCGFRNYDGIERCGVCGTERK